MAAVVIGAEIVAVGVAVADAIVADARRAAQAGVICLRRNMHRHRAASPAGTITVAGSRVVTTIVVWNLPAVRLLR
jgi:hypothetical protein